MGLTYELLLDLYRGRATAVEQITDFAQRKALAIETPITRMLKEFDALDSPRHVVLTGSAGDGKTFAALTAETRSFTVIGDASARRPGASGQPIDDLATQIETVLNNGRLLLAINRGQLERLYERTSPKGGGVGAFVSEVRARTIPQDAWPALDPSVAVADLGWLDRGSAARAIIDKVAGMSIPMHLAAPTREAFNLAIASLGSQHIAEWITSIVNAATAAGANVSMRQLWSFIAFLATGARAPTDDTPVSPADAVGARIFDAGAEGNLFAVALDRCDPSLRPNAALARKILTGEMLLHAKASGVGPLFANGCADGRTFSRIAIVHDFSGQTGFRGPEDPFAIATRALAQLSPGPQVLGAYSKMLLRGIYKSLGLWYTANTLPAWQTLCFDSSRLSTAAAVAASSLNPGDFKLALPRPPTDVAPYLGDSWRPPFLWLCGPGQLRLRVSRRAFGALLGSGASPRDVESADQFAFDTWLRRAGTSSRRTSVNDDGRLRVSRRGVSDCVVLEEGLRGKATISVE